MDEQDVTVEDFTNITTEKEKALFDLLRFKVMHCSAVVRILGKYDKEAKDEAEADLQKLVDKMIVIGYSRERIEQKIYSYWRYAESVYNGKKVKEIE